MTTRFSVVMPAAAAAVLAGCAQPALVLQARAPDWTVEGDAHVWRIGDVQVSAPVAYKREDFGFRGCVANHGFDPLRVVLRPVDVRGAGEVVALRMTSSSSDAWTPVGAGEVLDLPSRRDSAAPTSLCFRLPQTKGGTSVGRSYHRVADGTDYVVEIAGPGVELACPFRFNVDRDTNDDGVPWYAWPLLPLLPLYVLAHQLD